MSLVLPFDIISLIIDIVGEDNDKDLLKELALVSHSFLQISSKHLFATIELHDACPKYHVASSKKGFVRLLNSRPNVINYIRKLTYKTDDRAYKTEDNDCYPPPSFDNEDDLLSPILLNFLPTTSRLNCLKIDALNVHAGSRSDWNLLNPSLTSAFLHLMHLPTINHIDLSYICNFSWFSLTSSVNLHRLDILHLKHSHPQGGDSSYEIVLSEMMPKIREFHTSESSAQTKMLLHAKRQDGRPAFNFMDLRQVSMPFGWPGDERNIQYLLQNAKLLEKLHLSVEIDQKLVGLHVILSPIPRTLKVLDLDLSVDLHYGSIPLRLAVLCEELEAMAGHNMLPVEALSFDVHVGPVGHEAEVFIGSMIQEVEKVLIKSGWSALRQVSFEFSIACWGEAIRENLAKLPEALEFLSDKYPNLSKLEFISIDSSPYVVKCKFEFD